MNYLPVFLLFVSLINCYSATSDLVNIPLISGFEGLYANIGLGTPPQEFQLVIILDSVYVGVASDKCNPATQSLCRRQLFKSNESSTFVSTDVYDTFYVSELYGVLGGLKSNDYLRLGDDFILKTQDFIAINKSSNPKYHPPDVEGVFGLGPAQISPYKSFLQNLAESKALPAKFSIDTTKYDTTAVLVIGGSNESRYEPPMNYVPTISKTEWKVNAKASIGGINICENCIVSIDLQDTGISVPSDKFFEILLRIGAIVVPGPGTIFVDCRTLPWLPDLVLKMGDTTVTLKPTDYIAIEQSGQDKIGENTCLVLFDMGDDNKLNLGAAFSLRYLVEFDYETMQMGFARKN